MQLTNKSSKQNPIILHFPGLRTNPKKYKTWRYLSRKCLNSTFSLESTPELTIITFNSTNNKGIVEKQLDKSNTPYLLIGQDKPDWTNHDKIKFTLEALDIIDTKYVLCVDCYDILFFDSPKKALQIFKTLNCKMMFNAEHCFWPDCQNETTNIWKKYESSLTNSDMTYLNTGAWIGERQFCKEVYQKCTLGISDLIKSNDLPINLWKSKTSESDQIVMHRIWYENFRHSPHLTIDYDTQIFMNLANHEDILSLPIL